MRYSIGGFELELKTNATPLFCDALMKPFIQQEDVPAQLSYEETVLDPAMLAGSKLLERTGGYELLETESGLFLLNHWAQCRYAYGFWLKELSGSTRLFIHPDVAGQVPLHVSYLLSTAGLHRKLLEKDAAVIHASFIEHKGRAILFMGPSGTGKSTQADLWNRHAGAQIINGDRALLRKQNGIWYVYGYPCCGSSDICLNRTLPLGAAVILQQAAENRVEVLTPFRKICVLSAGTELYPWDSWEVQKVFHLAEQLSAEAPVFGFSCRPDEDAVRVLQNYLENELWS